MTATALLLADNPRVAASTMRRFELTHAVVELRRIWPRPENHEQVARVAAQVLLDDHAWQNHARAVALATLLDIGDHQQVINTLLTRLAADEASAGDLYVGARAIRLAGRRNTGRWVLGLAEQLEANGHLLTPETRQLVIEALRSPRQDFEDFDINAVQEVDLQILEVTTPIPGLVNATLRPIKSRGQCDRYAHHLQNCASGYVARVKSDACRLFGVEVDGKPVELIEVRPSTGQIVQWKGFANGAADPVRRRLVERFLVDQKLAVIR
ncbi:MAG: hypothetical protein F2612_02810 [Actinobacteria bacterium]|jgi:hypothetical protein|uniref:Unannotated protein n=1 Tax=freshwater metagenome TaxID=449393 RepID=A0A6J6DMF0_9ZZZZ|nr:hypothetical protein [Actinomycetota bacterium]MTA39510.1 hypothetical protein [Actinomycetota bacterium]